MRGVLNTSQQRWISKNREGANRSIRHALMIADFMVSVEISCRAHGGIRLIEPSEIISAAPQKTRALDNPYSIPARAKYLHPDTKRVCDGKIGVVPDKIFGLRNIDAGTVQYFFFEADTGTVPLTDKNPKRHSVLETLAAYMHIANTGKHTEHFGIPEFVVLFLTHSRERVLHMRALIEHLTDSKGSPRFLFRSHPRLYHATKSFQPIDHYLALPWKRARRSNISLLLLLTRSSQQRI